MKCIALVLQKGRPVYKQAQDPESAVLPSLTEEHWTEERSPSLLTAQHKKKFALRPKQL